eukprot:CAMPEP_0176205382 /NCGR_PEP_ID=MMETSP0121_2-20121125/11567_1 /TAXON_ID=160619 /ORGANISM="Kryptoperidinium foliaceum, Strain CCMP 1326" /LENGTH=87 /DNA_ID=CAMNT_0017544317 /DNA_START=219 /DNA_END=477 /DNA_ORIENTATION=-
MRRVWSLLACTGLVLDSSAYRHLSGQGSLVSAAGLQAVASHLRYHASSVAIAKRGASARALGTRAMWVGGKLFLHVGPIPTTSEARG